MKNRTPVVLSILAFAALFITPLIMLLFEQERTEAIAFGVIAGSVIGTILGIIALVLNKGRSKRIIVFR